MTQLFIFSVIILQDVLKLINFYFKCFTIFLGKIKIKGDFKGSHKKTDRAFKNSRAIDDRILSYFFKKHVMGAIGAQAFPMGQARETHALALTGI